jgi:hypothetical protein
MTGVKRRGIYSFQEYKQTAIDSRVRTTTLNRIFPYDTYAIFAYAAESKTIGLGAAGGVAGPFDTAGEVNLNPDHSGQFRLDNMSRGGYWNVLMKRFGLTPTNDSTQGLGGRP